MEIPLRKLIYGRKLLILFSKTAIPIEITFHVFPLNDPVKDHKNKQEI